MIAIVMSWKNKGLVKVALVAVLTAIFIEILLPILF